jgi:thiol-disulfide isomerase/thioredoxin
MLGNPCSFRVAATWLTLATGLTVVVGCAPAPSTTETSRAKSTAAEPATQPASASEAACCCDPAEDSTTAQKPPVAPPVQLKVVKFDQWQAAVKAQRGKVVVVDVWASNCGPCRKEFPHLVELSRRYARDGVAFMSVSVDPVDNKASALAFLQKHNPPFTNYLLDEDHHLWQDKWDVNGLPAVLVFDQRGEQVRKIDNDDPGKPFTTADVETVLKELARPGR